MMSSVEDNVRSRTSVTDVLRRMLGLRFVRYGLVGGMGIPVNMILLWFFHSVLRMPLVPAWICAPPSSLLNFYANQRFTYHDQDHLRGWAWPVRALKAQASRSRARW